MPSKHDPFDSLTDIVENIDLIGEYRGASSFEELVADRMRRDAIERCPSRLTEAGFRLGVDADKLVPGEPSSQIRGLGNRLRHAFDALDYDRL